MIGRSSLLSAALLAGLASAGSAHAYEPNASSRRRTPVQEFGGKLMMLGVSKSGRGSAAKDKRAATKRRNQLRNKAAHRG